MQPKRKYELKRRAEQMGETRLRIAEAAIELHGTVGPSRTTLSAVAERAAWSAAPSTATSPPRPTCSRLARPTPSQPTPWPDLAACDLRLPGGVLHEDALRVPDPRLRLARV